jgi:hypothetical protein
MKNISVKHFILSFQSFFIWQFIVSSYSICYKFNMAQVGPLENHEVRILRETNLFLFAYNKHNIFAFNRNPSQNNFTNISRYIWTN